MSSDADPDRTVYIAGAGIAGLTLALCLAKFGFTVVVLERESAPQPFGAGLQISPNARYILNMLGLSEAVAAASFEPEALDIYPFGRTSPIASLSFGKTATERYGVPYATMHRADLAKVLLTAAKHQAAIAIHYGVARTEIAEHALGISAQIELADHTLRTVRPFAFIGADGVHSDTRIRLLGGPPAAYSGLVAWRALVPMKVLAPLIATDRTSLMFGPGTHIVLYPMPVYDQFNVVMFTRVAKKRLGNAKNTGRPKLDRYYVKRCALVRALFEAIGDKWTTWPLNAVQTDTWHKGCVGLIGDAAHAMLPFQAQGAAMAIEDSALLAAELDRAKKPHTAFTRFEALRRPRIERVVARSARNGTIFHLPGPLCYGRDLVVANRDPATHFSSLDWLYGYDPFRVANVTTP
jgi:2-polyprenyl-6-methoxyphenol hydroxylase-like FAD-dependent oxidoreductase